MKISWITYAHFKQGNDGNITSDTASIRYRVIAPARYLKAFTHQFVAVTPEVSQQDLENAAKTDIIIFSKSFLPVNEALAKAVKSIGAKMIFDVCDNHYESAEFGVHYKNMSALADQVVCNTAEMAKIAAAYCKKPPIVIEDPYEGPRGIPTFAPGECIKLLWFGHSTNLDSLQESLADLVKFSMRRPLSILLLTQIGDGILSANKQVNDLYGKHITMSARQWSLDAQWEELKVCDAVIIPSLKNEYKFVKSANRMIEAIWAGKPVAAQIMPAYLPFNQWTPVRPTLSEGLEGLLRNQDKIPVLLSAAQGYIEQHYSPARLAKQWEQVITSLKEQA